MEAICLIAFAVNQFMSSPIRASDNNSHRLSNTYCVRKDTISLISPGDDYYFSNAKQNFAKLLPLQIYLASALSPISFVRSKLIVLHFTKSSVSTNSPSYIDFWSIEVALETCKMHSYHHDACIFFRLYFVNL